MMIELKHISKSFGKDTYKRDLFQDLTISIEQGEMVAIMGKSGCGKTTLLNIIGGIERIDRGIFLYKGKDMQDSSNKEILRFRRHEVSFIFQNFSLIEEYNVYENIELPLLYKFGTHNNKKRIKTILKDINIEYLTKRSVNHLSGGEKQRVAIARALVNGNEVLLADEPTGSLDENTGKEIIELLQRLNHMGKTIIIVTHDIDVARCCNRIIEL